MNIEVEKNWLVKKIAEINSEELIESLKAVILNSKTGNVDFWDELHDDIKADVETALNEIEQGDFTPHSEVKKQYEKWLKK